MKTNKLKTLLITIFCFSAFLFPEAQCMEKERVNDNRVRDYQTKFVPTGSVMAFAGETPPNGWLLCDGKRYTSLNYPELYEVVKTKYVPDSEQWIIKANENSTIEKFFHVPDLRGRIIVGVDSETGRVTSNNTLGSVGGEESHILTFSEMPKHHHSFSIQWTGGDYCGVLFHVEGGNGGGTSGKHIDVTKVGGDQPHNNMQPYQILNYIINTGNINDQAEFYKLQNEIDQLKEKIHSLEIHQQKYEAIFSGRTLIYLKSNSHNHGADYEYLDCNSNDNHVYMSNGRGSGNRWSLITFQ